MPRLLHVGQWFDPVGGAALYEADYEAALLAHAETLFPDFYCVRFKELVESEYGSGKPDLALIDKQYRRWYVVEVELDVHPLHGHVEEQVKKFAFGNYGSRHRQALASQCDEIDERKLEALFLGDQPQVLVLVTKAKPAWSSSLEKYGAKVGVIEVFRDDQDRTILRVNGDQPHSYDASVVTACRLDPQLPNALRLSSVAAFETSPLELRIGDELTEWRLLKVADAAWLIASSRFAFESMQGQDLLILEVGNAFVLTTSEEYGGDGN